MNENIYGALDNIKKIDIARLESWLTYKLDSHQLLSESLLVDVVAMSHRLQKEIALYVTRKGQVQSVVLGQKADAMVPPELERLRNQKVRCIHTHPMGSSMLSDLDWSVLTLFHLDAMAAIGIGNEGQVTGITIGYGEGDSLFSEHFTDVASLMEHDMLPVIERSKKDLPLAGAAYTHFGEPEKAILIGVVVQEDERLEPDLWELKELARTAGLDVVCEILQKREHGSGKTYLGTGKIQEVKREIQRWDLDVVVADDELSPQQQMYLEEHLGIKVIDRAMLILDIFASRARSKEGKLQVELAQLKNLAPKLTGYGTSLSRLGGGIGTRGPGETKLEVDRRTIRKKIFMLQKQLQSIVDSRDQRRRDHQEMLQVALVGYTNAGKSSLLNLMAEENQFAQDLLFATLDPVTRKVCTAKHGCFLLSDTVGFIHKLPHDLIAAFRATLEEVKQADLLIHVVDGHAREWMHQMRAVEEVLKELNVEDKPCLLVVNKMDLLEEEEKTKRQLLLPHALFISCKQKENIDLLLQAIEQHLLMEKVKCTVLIPYDQGDLLDLVFQDVQDYTVTYAENGYEIQGQFREQALALLEKRNISLQRNLPS